MKKMLFILFSFAMNAVFAQEKVQHAGKPLKFETIIQGGLLAGSSTESFALQTINGFSFGKWYAGVGAGLDFYMQRGVPLFADVRYHFSNQRKSFFIYTDAGAHIPWIKNKEQRNIISQGTGLYTDAGVGFRLATKKGDAFLFSAGYSYKHVPEKQEGFSWQSWPWPQQTDETVLNYNYRFNRVTVKFGFMF
jgi:hypothetical protein